MSAKTLIVNRNEYYSFMNALEADLYKIQKRNSREVEFGEISSKISVIDVGSCNGQVLVIMIQLQ